MPHGLLRDRHSAGAFAAQDGRHRRQQRRALVEGETRIGNAEIVDPGDLRIEPDHLPEREDDADQKHEADQCVKSGIGKEGLNDLLVEHHHHEGAEHQEHQHPNQEYPGRGQLRQFDLHRRTGGGGWCGHRSVIHGKMLLRSILWHSGAGKKAGSRRRRGENAELRRETRHWFATYLAKRCYLSLLTGV